jgi:leucyl-tRNA synthetase
VPSKVLDEQPTPAQPDQALATPYDHRAIERKWQAAWQDADLFRAPGQTSVPPGSPPAYIFTEQPVPAHTASLDLVRGYAIADAHARFLRARGAPVLLSLLFQAFGTGVEHDAIAQGASPSAWVDRCTTRIARQFRALGFSIDFSRASSTANSSTYQWSQLLFVTLLSNGFVYRAQDTWYWRIGRYLNESQQAAEALTAWNDLALASQDANLGSISGVELDVASLDGMPLTVFTTHPDDVAKARFIAISPNHPDVQQWMPTVDDKATADDTPIWERTDPISRLASGLSVDTGRLATGAGTHDPIPVVISPAVDARFGPTAVLGIPAVQAADRELLQEIPTSTATTWRVEDTGPPALRPTHRYTHHDIPISDPAAWGTPIPVLHCDTCGVLPLTPADLPLRLDAATDTTTPAGACPHCSGPTRPETDTLTPAFDALWAWIAPCVQHIATKGLFSNQQLASWLPAAYAVRGPDPDGTTFYQRIAAKAMRDAQLLTHLPDGEPFTAMTMHQAVQPGTSKEVINLDSMIKRLGADSIRLTMLYAAAPATTLTWRTHTVRYCDNWLTSFVHYATPRLHDLQSLPQPDDSEGAVELRHRLQSWSRTAVERVTENYEALQPHRAVRNVMTLLVRIRDFEHRVLKENGELAPTDRRALAHALQVAVQLIAPVTPHVAEDMWATAGGEGLLAAAPWPTIHPGNVASYPSQIPLTRIPNTGH